MLFTLGLATSHAQSLPKFVTAGKLDCAARLATPTQLQTWCYKGTKLAQNTLSDISDSLGNVGGSAFINFVDATPGEVWVMIGWNVWFDHTDAKYHYQVSWQINSGGTSKSLAGTF